MQWEKDMQPEEVYEKDILERLSLCKHDILFKKSKGQLLIFDLDTISLIFVSSSFQNCFDSVSKISPIQQVHFKYKEAAWEPHLVQNVHMIENKIKYQRPNTRDCLL